MKANLRTAMLLVSIVASPAAIPSMAQLQDPFVYRAYYAGTIGDEHIQLDILVDRDSVSGAYYYESDGIPLSLVGKIRWDESIDPDDPRVCLSVRLHRDQADSDKPIDELHAFDSKGNLWGSFEGFPVSLTRLVEGDWKTTDGARKLDFELTKVAEYVFRTTQQGLRFSSINVLPVFLMMNPAFQHINRFILQKTLSQHESNMVGFQEFYTERLNNDHLRNQIKPNNYGSIGYTVCSQQHVDCRVVYYSDHLVSVLCEGISYGGGAHENYGYEPMNFWIMGDTAKVVELSDLFVPGSRYVEILSELCITDLGRHGASWIITGKISSFEYHDLKRFSLSPRGLQFAFGPYEVGSFAEGTYKVVIPFKDVNNIINTEGPLRRLMGGG